MVALERLNNRYGMTLVEMLLAITILAMLAAAVRPAIITRAQNRAADKIVHEIMGLQNIANAYYVDKGGVWPRNIDDLINSGYLTEESKRWTEKNPFGYSYNIGLPEPPSIDPAIISFLQQEPAYEIPTLGPRYLTVSTYVPEALADGIRRRLPLAGITGAIDQYRKVSSAIVVPGVKLDLALAQIRKYADIKIKYLKEVWVPANIKIYSNPHRIGWWDRYGPWPPDPVESVGYIGNDMMGRRLRLKAGENEYDLGITFARDLDNVVGVVYRYTEVQEADPSTPRGDYYKKKQAFLSNVEDYNGKEIKTEPVCDVGQDCAK